MVLSCAKKIIAGQLLIIGNGNVNNLSSDIHYLSKENK